MATVGETMSDLSRGYVPIILVCSMIAAALFTGMYFKGNEAQISSINTKVGDLSVQVSTLSTAVSQISLAVAKGTPLPDNIAFKADLLRFCVENRELKCPPNL